VTQCLGPHRTTALCSESVTVVRSDQGVLTDTHSVTCSKLQEDGLAPVRADAARQLFAKRGLVSHLQKTERNSRVSMDCPFFPEYSAVLRTSLTPTFVYCRHKTIAAQLITERADITWHIFTDYFAIHSTFSCIFHIRTAFEVRRTDVHFRDT